MPHAVKDNYRPFLSFACGPLLVASHNLLDVLAPDYTVARSNHINIQAAQGLERRLRLTAVEHQDIGIVFLTFKHQRAKIHFIIKAAA